MALWDNPSRVSISDAGGYASNKAKKKQKSSTELNLEARLAQERQAAELRQRTAGGAGTVAGTGTAAGGIGAVLGNTGAKKGAAAGASSGSGTAYQAGQPSGGVSGYLTGYNPGSFQPSDYTTAYRDRLAGLEASGPDPFRSRYQGDIDRILETIQGREAFDPDSVYQSGLYKNYRDQYTTQGRQAMMDAQGNAAALTGGYGSTYSAAAGQQAYDNYLLQLNDRGLDIYDRMYQQYLDEGSELYRQLNAYNNQDAVDYGRYRDDVSDYQWGLGYLSDRYEQSRADDYQNYQGDLARQQWAEEYAYQRAQDALSQQNWERQFGYQQQQDALAQQNWERQFGYQQQQDALAQQNWLKEFAYTKESDEADRAKKTSSAAGAGSGSSGTSKVSAPQYGLFDLPVSDTYFYTVEQTVAALPGNASRFDYLYGIAQNDAELERLCAYFGVTPEDDSDSGMADADESYKKMAQKYLRLRGY